jgi:hypothetical protein
MDTKLKEDENAYPQLSGKLCWKIALLVIEILKVQVGYLFSNDFM